MESFEKLINLVYFRLNLSGCSLGVSILNLKYLDEGLK